ncbi:MAG: acyl-CoA/acyl-ACP dehydrogenase [Sandaracinaceae bacterium]|nr:acyl-CoA/acyl-ACP dehydrogenase [Sandaracinaceae bacterium]
MTTNAYAPELEDVRRAVRASLAPFGPEYWRQLDSERAFPEALFAAMGRAGWFGTLIPERWGGADVGPAVASVVVEEINRAGGDATTINAQMAICGTLVRDGTDAQRERYLPGVADGSIRFLSVAATEPDSGADMSTLESKGRRYGEGWVLSASKVLISLAEHTRLLILLVSTEEGPTLFLLDEEDVGGALEVQPIEMITNRMTTSLYLDELYVHDDCRLGPPGKGLACLMKGFAPRRVLAAAEALGHARFMLDRSLAHAKERETFGRPIGQNQGVQYPLTRAYASVEAADLMRWDALRLVEADDPAAGGRSALAKILASEAAWETARAALTTFGGWALSADYHIERKLRDATVFVFNNLLLSYVAERVLELPKAY